MTQLNNWRIEFGKAESGDGEFGDGESGGESGDDFCQLILNKPNARQNVLSAEVIAELDSALDEIERVAPAGVIVRSAKDGGFIVGADVGEFGAIESIDAATRMIESAHGVFNRLEALPMPSVALINGHCLGGGLELALACDYRVVCERPTIRLGLPEVLLGIHPGFGGCARLIELIGAPAAMGMMLSGRAIAPRAATRIGLVDLVAPQRQLQRTARHIL
ncbi:MAG: enoyl-CoA hydratase-related protein, partial [bacterium]